MTSLLQRPTTPDELGAFVRTAAAEKKHLRLAGSDSLPMTRFPASHEVQTLSTLRMNKLIEHAVSDMTVIVEAGMNLETLQRHLAWQNQWLPVDPPSYRGRPPGQRTLGGLIATNSLGPLRFGSGDWRLLIMGMKCVDGTGTLIKGGGRTVKNVAGYSIPRLMIGSCGSLAAIVEVTLRTFARPADEQCAIFFCDSPQRAEELIAEVLLSPVRPAYIEAIGAKTFAANPLQLPTMTTGTAVVVGFLDRPQSCVAQIEMVRGLAAARGLESISQTAAQSGRLRLWLTSEPATETGIGARIHALSSQACAIVAQLEERAAASGASAWAVSEAGTGAVRAVIDSPQAASIVHEVAEKHAAALVVTQASGGVAATMSTGSSALTARIKSALDPSGVFGISPA